MGNFVRPDEYLRYTCLYLLSLFISLFTSGYIFQGLNGHISPATMSAVLKRMKVTTDVAVVHGVRSTFKTRASETTTHANEVSEAALSHVISDKVEAAYSRGDFMAKRKKLMQEWGDYSTF